MPICRELAETGAILKASASIGAHGKSFVSKSLFAAPHVSRYRRGIIISCGIAITRGERRRRVAKFMIINGRSTYLALWPKMQLEISNCRTHRVRRCVRTVLAGSSRGAWHSARSAVPRYRSGAVYVCGTSQAIFEISFLASAHKQARLYLYDNADDH